MTAYYNEFDPFAAAWLRELIKAGLIAPGDVDERSIADVRPEDLTGYTQCHFFAGIGGWSYALRLAGWSDSRPVWTGSCPCQPFSAAGKQQGTKDERHLWPEFFRLIRECRPDAVFGEQVANAIGHDWLDHVSADLEGEGYAVGSIVLGAHSVGAPHIRQRLWFVAESNEQQRHGLRNAGARGRGESANGSELADPERRTAERRGHDLAAAPCGTQGETRERQRIRDDAGASRDVGELGNADARGREQTEAVSRCAAAECGVPSAFSELAHHHHQGLEGRERAEERAAERAAGAGGLAGFWNPADWLPCRDGKARAVEPGTFPLAHGVSARVGRLRGYGNAIVPQAAAEVIRTYMEY